MWFGRVHLRRFIIIACLASSGCAQSGNSFLARRTTVGSLKTGLSHLEFENNQLKSKVAELKSINRDAEDRLVQEESANGELKARLDNALKPSARDVLPSQSESPHSPGSVESSNPSPTTSKTPRLTSPPRTNAEAIPTTKAGRATSPSGCRSAAA